MDIKLKNIAIEELLPTCQQIKDQQGRLIALWGSDNRAKQQSYGLHLAFADLNKIMCLNLNLDSRDPSYPNISELFPTANRMQRATYDLLGLRALGSKDVRPWLRHQSWDFFPLRKDHVPNLEHSALVDREIFVRVAGVGVHEIPVGPIHAGIIEPGHFRFQAVGEQVLRLEQRLGYTHKGVEKRFESLNLKTGARLAARICGDSTVAYSLAYAVAVENLSHAKVPQRALWLRALFLERERIANHLGDLGALANEVGFAVGLSQFSILKEDLLRLNQKLFKHRYLMDCIIPGGVNSDLDLDQEKIALLQKEITILKQEVGTLEKIYKEHGGLQDRFLNTGIVSPKLAQKMGLTGLAGRASGQAFDLRVHMPCAPYSHFQIPLCLQRNGDVLARVTIRFEEIFQSLNLIAKILDTLPSGQLNISLEQNNSQFGLGLVEGWRGEILVALHLVPGEDNIHRAHVHDPSWQNWPLLEHAVIDNIVPDFPLINKSFNLSYSGHDL